MERLNAPFTVYVTTGMITRTIDAWWFGLAAPPRLFGIEPPRARIEAVRLVDMSSSNAWAEFSNVFCRTREAYLEHENAKAELKGLMPEDAKEAIGHGIRAKRSKSGAVSFDVLSMEGTTHAPLQ